MAQVVRELRAGLPDGGHPGRRRRLDGPHDPRGPRGRRQGRGPALQRRGRRRDADRLPARGAMRVRRRRAGRRRRPARPRLRGSLWWPSSSTPTSSSGRGSPARGPTASAAPRAWAMSCSSFALTRVSAPPCRTRPPGSGVGPPRHPPVRPALPGGVPGRHDRLAGDRLPRRAHRPRGPGGDADPAGRPAEPRAVQVDPVPRQVRARARSRPDQAPDALGEPE